MLEPDLGTALVIAFTIAALLIAAGCRCRYLALLVALGHRRGDPPGAGPAVRARAADVVPAPVGGGDQGRPGYQAVQGQIALGSGGLLGVGLGRSVQKIFYLPEAQTDFILAVIGEELGVIGILGVGSCTG